MHLSKLSSKGQVTIPKEIREALGISPGDHVAYEIKGHEATIKRVAPFDAAFHLSISETLEEWNSLEDDEAFDDL